MDYKDEGQIKLLALKDILHLTIVCFILAILIAALILKAIFRADLFNSDINAFIISLMTGASISYALGNITIYRYYQNQKK